MKSQLWPNTYRFWLRVFLKNLVHQYIALSPDLRTTVVCFSILQVNIDCGRCLKWGGWYYTLPVTSWLQSGLHGYAMKWHSVKTHLGSIWARRSGVSMSPQSGSWAKPQPPSDSSDYVVANLCAKMSFWLVGFYWNKLDSKVYSVIVKSGSNNVSHTGKSG